MIQWTLNNTRLNRHSSTTTTRSSTQDGTITRNSKSEKAKRRRTLPSLLSSSSRSSSLGSIIRISPDAALVIGGLPAQVWRIIISQYLRDADIKTITLVCRSLCGISQPYLFRKLVFHPYSKTPAGSLGNKGFALVHWPYKRTFSKKLEFLLLPHIATAVTHVSISPSDAECIWEQSHLAMDSILDAIFTTLPNFPHLATLVCSHIRITTQRMIGLRVLRLRSISLDACSFDEGCSRMLGMDVMPLDTVRLNGVAPDAAFFSLFLNPPHLRRLYATPCDTILAALMRKEKPFHHLTDLDISLACIPSQDFIPVLSKCPHLKRLCIHQPQPTRERIRKHKLESLPSTLIPELNFYRGPHAYLSRILDSRKVKTVDVSFSCSPESIIKVAEKVEDRYRDQVESLTLPPTTVPRTFLGEILVLFPNACFLNIKRVSCTPSEWRERFLASEITPKPILRALYFEVDTGEPYLNWEHPDRQTREALLTFVGFFPLLLKLFPQLRTVQMMYSGLLGGALNWRKSTASGDALDCRDIHVDVDVNQPGGRGRKLSPEEVEAVISELSKTH